MEKIFDNSNMKKIRRVNHSAYQLNYHFVFIPKYRKSILKDGLAESLNEIIREICKHYGFEIYALEIRSDHLHIFLSAPPKWSPLKICRTIKSISARKIFQKKTPSTKKR